MLTYHADGHHQAADSLDTRWLVLKAKDNDCNRAQTRQFQSHAAARSADVRRTEHDAQATGSSDLQIKHMLATERQPLLPQGQNYRTIGAVSSSRQSSTRNCVNTVATMPRLIMPRRISTAASEFKTDARTIVTTANSHGVALTRERAFMAKRRMCFVSATTTADMLSAYKALRGMHESLLCAKGYHLGSVSAALFFCVEPEVVLAALAATSVSADQGLRTYLHLALPDNAHSLCTSRLTVAAKDVADGSEITIKQFDSRDTLIDVLVAATTVGPQTSMERVWKMVAVPAERFSDRFESAWVPYVCEGSGGFQTAISLNASRRSEPAHFDSDLLCQKTAMSLALGCDRGDWWGATGTAFK